MFTEVITSYTTNPEIRNLANNCISDIFKPSPLEEEDSNESFSSDSSDSDEDEITNETPAQKETEIRIATPRIESNKPTYIDKHPSVAENYRAIDPLNIKDDLMHERSARKKLEEEVIHLKKKLKESEARFEDHLETLNQNQQLSADLEVSQRSVKDLKLKVQTCQQEIESDRTKFDIDLKEREKNLCQDISNLKESMEEKDRIIEKLKQEKIENNLDKQNLVEDVLLFEWMIVAIRMDLTMHRQNITTTFDKSSFYEKLKREKIPHSEWPKRISTEMSIKNTNTSRSKLITKNDPQVKYNNK
jgi:chromosome segregation ATPase